MRPLSDRFSEYVCLSLPEAPRGDLDDRLSVVLGEARPAVLCWDGEGAAAVRLGRGGPDPLLLEAGYLSNQVAIRRDLLSADEQTEAEPARFAQSAAGALRSPGATALWIPEIVSTTTAPEPRPASAEAMRTSPERLTVAVLVHQPNPDPAATLAAIARQSLTSRLDLVVVLSGSDADAVQAQAEGVQSWAKTTSIKLRRYVLGGDLGPAYLANVAVGLALGEVVVLVEAGCLPEGETMLQQLADATWGGEQATVSPLIGDGEGALCAGLAVRGGDDGDRLAVWREPTPLNRRRLVAAPAPGLFALQRRRWIASGGAPHAAAPLWTAGLAGKAAAPGRHLLNGDLRAVWPGAAGMAQASAPVPRALRASSRAALRLGAIGDHGDPGTAERGPTSAGAVAGWAFRDAEAAIPGARRLLVVADRMGPSQSIPFIDGLRGARARGAVTVGVISLDRQAAPDDLAQKIEAFAPHVVVASRLDCRATWSVLRTAKAARGFDLVLHLDDDLLEAPVTLGIDRYRIARNPRSVMAMAHMIDGSDAVLAATETLAERLRTLGATRVATMPIGSAAVAPGPRHRPVRDQIKLVYVGSASHDPDLRMIAEPLNAVLADNPHVSLTLFGSIAKQPAAKLLTGAVTRIANVQGDYLAFRRRLAELEFDIGLAPLSESHFNRAKTSTKWVEYAEAGLAVIASRAGPYAALAAEGLVLGVDDSQWRQGLQRMIDSDALRRELVRRSDDRLQTAYGWDRMEAGVFATLFPDRLEAAA